MCKCRLEAVFTFCVVYKDVKVAFISGSFIDRTFGMWKPLPLLYWCTVHKENGINLRCTMGWFDNICCEMITTIKFVNTSITSHSYLWGVCVCVCVCVCVMRTFKICSLRKFQVCSTVLLTVVTMLHITSPGLSHQTGSLPPLTDISLFPSPPRPWQWQPPFYSLFKEFGVLGWEWVFFLFFFFKVTQSFEKQEERSHSCSWYYSHGARRTQLLSDLNHWAFYYRYTQCWAFLLNLTRMGSGWPAPQRRSEEAKKRLTCNQSETTACRKRGTLPSLFNWLVRSVAEPGQAHWRVQE